MATYGCTDTRKTTAISNYELLSDGPYILECPSPYVLVVLRDLTVKDTTSIRTQPRLATDRAYCVLADHIFTESDKGNSKIRRYQEVKNEVSFRNELLLAWVTTNEGTKGKLGHHTQSVHVPRIWIYGPWKHYKRAERTYKDVSSVVVENPPGWNHIEWTVDIENSGKGSVFGFEYTDELRLHIAVIDLDGEQFY